MTGKESNTARADVRAGKHKTAGVRAQDESITARAREEQQEGAETMNKIKITDRAGRTFTRINKAAACRAYMAGVEVWTVPCNFRPSWLTALVLDRESRAALLQRFSAIEAV